MSANFARLLKYKDELRITIVIRLIVNRLWDFKIVFYVVPLLTKLLNSNYNKRHLQRRRWRL